MNFCVPDANGWLRPGRCSSTGEDRTQECDSYTVTNYFTVQNGDIVYVKNLDMGGSNPLYSAVYKSSETGTKKKGLGFVMTAAGNNGCVTDIDLSGEWQRFSVTYADAGYMRLCGIIPEGKTAADIVISIQRDGQWLTADK